MHGKYIVVEGLEGSGKTTALNTIKITLRNLGIKKIIFTHEPGGTYIAEKLKNLVLNIEHSNNEILNYKTEMLIFYAARIQLVETVIKPALSSGKWVIGDRHDLSTQAYQGGGRNINQNILTVLRDALLGDFRPELTLYLDITPEISLMRICNRVKLDRIERETLAFFHRTRNRYLELAALDNSIHIVDATRTFEIVSATIRDIIIHWFQYQ